MSDWAPGDLALCVRGGEPEFIDGLRENGADYRLRSGALYRVRWAGMSALREIVGLKFEDLDWGWFGNRFVKVTPPEADEFDREVIELMNRIPTLANQAERTRLLDGC